MAKRREKLQQSLTDISSLRILGIDTGLATVGYGIIHRATALDYGAIATSADDPLPLRLKTIRDDLLQLCEMWQPEVAAIEYPFFGRSNTNQGKVIQALGVIRLALAEAGINEHILLHQSTIKSVVAAYGADKSEIQWTVMQIFDLPALPQPDDAADGLAIAYTAQLGHRANIE